MTDVADAAAAVRDGDLVVFPTETVYGLGADALDPAAVERVFEAKERSRDKPISLAVPDVDAAVEHTEPTEREERFMRAFLPGPVTVVVERGPDVPDVLTAGREQVGVRVPDHDVALDLLAAAGTPITATSANVSGNPSATRVDELDERIRERAAAVVDDGETEGGTGSTVVDVEAGELLREGAVADEVRAWLAEQPQS
ncbi:L-threonylcarbamoyladenylate synthase [Halomicrobium urmianum]|uniref:L-threonylcarbamoyladenylate synthase n=1 Tax=Halomicrobium urmianum TaxID=1586233 RepID=UPI001CD9F302|nr:L-threonylcarbamoyladenylate synthase [Halomicrobium urmianum]